MTQDWLDDAVTWMKIESLQINYQFKHLWTWLWWKWERNFSLFRGLRLLWPSFPIRLVWDRKISFSCTMINDFQSLKFGWELRMLHSNSDPPKPPNPQTPPPPPPPTTFSVPIKFSQQLKCWVQWVLISLKICKENWILLALLHSCWLSCP